MFDGSMEQTKLWHPLENEGKFIDINELRCVCTSVHVPNTTIHKLVCETWQRNWNQIFSES